MMNRIVFTSCLLLLLIPTVHADALEDLKAFITEATNSGKIKKEQENWKTRLPKFPPVEFADDERYQWVIETTEGTMTADLYTEAAPDHVRNILYLSTLGYYDGILFHRIIPGFMAQGGCPLGTGTGGPGYTLNLEAKPEWRHEGPGILSMARTPNPNSAGSQFFLTFKSTPFLDNQYTVFGKVTEGLEVLKKLEAAGNPDPQSNGVPPVKEIRILSTSVQRTGAAETP